jgi:hypothetical protein
VAWISYLRWVVLAIPADVVVLLVVHGFRAPERPPDPGR